MKHFLLAARYKRVRGFSLVEIAMGLAMLGILVMMGLKAQEVVEQYRQTQFVNQVQSLQASMRAYAQTYGRWPGDCDRDGLIDYVLDSPTSIKNADGLDYAVPSQLSAASSASDTYSLGMVCPSTSLAPFAKMNVPFNELKLGGQVPATEPNRKSANHNLGGFSFPGTFEVPVALTGTSTIETRFNAIVLTQVPVSAARRLATAINGFDGSAANQGRIRRSDDLVSFASTWSSASETQDKKITVVWFFDRIPPNP